MSSISGSAGGKIAGIAAVMTLFLSAFMPLTTAAADEAAPPKRAKSGEEPAAWKTGAAAVEAGEGMGPGDFTMPPPPPPPGESEMGPGSNRRANIKGSQLWRAYSALSESERKAMMELQNKDPDSFRQKLQEKAEIMMKQERENAKKLNNLLVAYRFANAHDRQVIENKITEIVRADYRQKQEDNRRHLDGMKKRVAQLEKDLEKRESNAESAIKAIVDDMISKAVNP
jgi:hypothetical protein